MLFNQLSFHDYMIGNNIVDVFEEPITLKSGSKSHLYVNWRKAANTVQSIDWLSEKLLKFAKDNNLNPDCFLGVPEGASKLATITNYKYAKDTGKNIALPMGRGKPKTHGDPKDKFFVGSPQGRIVLIEDVITTGGSLFNFIDQIQELDITIEGVICLTNRNTDPDTLNQQLTNRDINLYSMANLQDLISEFLEKNPGHNSNVIEALNAEFQFSKNKIAV